MIIYLLVTFGLIFGSEEKLQKLHATAINETKGKNLSKAKEAFEEILTLIDPPTASHGQNYPTDWPTYVDLVLRYCQTDLALKNFESAEKSLLSLKRLIPPVEYLSAIEIMSAKIAAAQGEQKIAFCTLKKVQESFPIELWKGEDRTFFHALELSLGDHFEELEKKGRLFLLAGDPEKALGFYEEILKAIETRSYPQLVMGGIYHQKIGCQIAECHYLISPDNLSAASEFFREKKLYIKALDECKTNDQFKYAEEALFERALQAFSRSNFAYASLELEELVTKAADERIKLASLIILAKIALHEKNLHKSDKILSFLQPTLKNDDPLKAEIASLRRQEAKIQNLEEQKQTPDRPLTPSLTFLKQYSFEEYNKGETRALVALKKFSLLFPNDPLNTLVYYFLGVNEKNVIEAKNYFKKAIEVFDTSSNNLSLHYFYNRCLIEFTTLALLYDERDLPFAKSAFKKQNSLLLPSLLEESQLIYAKALIELGEEEEGREVLVNLLAYFHKSGIVEGAFFSRVWHELGYSVD